MMMASIDFNNSKHQNGSQRKVITRGSILVLGNETCDLDSTVCSLLLAQHLNTQSFHGSTFRFVPVMNTMNKQETLATRPVVMHILGERENELYSLADLEQGVEEWTLFLVDHHVCNLAERHGLTRILFNVFGVVDHRLVANESLLDQFRSLPFGSIILPCCSCASILVTHFKLLDPLLIITIRWDSMDFTFRMTSLDYEARSYFLQDNQSIFQGLANYVYDKEYSFAKLSKLEDDTKLSLKTLLEKDYKKYKTSNGNEEQLYAMCTAHISLVKDLNFEHLEGLQDNDGMDVCKILGVDLVVLCGTFKAEYDNSPTNDQFAFQMLILNPKRLLDVERFLEGCTKELGVHWKAISHPQCPSLIIYDKVEVEAQIGRKIVQPILQKILDEK